MYVHKKGDDKGNNKITNVQVLRAVSMWLNHLRIMLSTFFRTLVDEEEMVLVRYRGFLCM